jgi:hypothetical protein
MIVKCNRKCFDSVKCRHYYPGDQDDINPLDPIAGHFDFPPGTEVYFKQRGTKTTPAISTTRIIPGLVEDEKKKNPVVGETVKTDSEKVTCDICGIYTGTEGQVRAHKYHCAKKQANAG